MRRFCVLTTGRAGSTSLMQALAAYDDIGVPSKQVDCPNNELFMWHNRERYWRDYEQFSGMPVSDDLSLARAFYASNETSAYAGFKTMPNRHRNLARLLSANAVKVIRLVRRDLAATIASFIAARDFGSWQRDGEPQNCRFEFSPAYAPRVDAHLLYLLSCTRTFNRLRGAICVEFEQLCDRAFCHEALNDYFQRPIRLIAPRPPVDAATYIDNWPVFTRYIERRVAEFKRQTPAP